jgi:hypothetical protein
MAFFPLPLWAKITKRSRPPQTAKLSKSATFSVTASGTTPLTYQWLKKVGASPIFVVIPGETSASLSLKKVTASDAGSYEVIVSNAAGTASSTAILTVQ